jgi:hypothetical protein
VRDEQATIGTTFHGTKDTSTSRGTVKTNIQVGLERTTFLAVNLGGLGHLVLSVNLLNTLEAVLKAELGKSSAGEEKTSGIGSSPVGETVLDAVPGKLVRVGGSEDLVTDNLGGDDLADHL